MSRVDRSATSGSGASRQPQPRASPEKVPRKFGWTKEEAELSISGVPEVRVLTNFDPDSFSVQDYVERLRRKAASESNERSREMLLRKRMDEETKLNNPFVLTASEMRAHKRNASSVTAVDVDDDRLTHAASRRPAQLDSQRPAALGQQQEDLEWDNDLFPHRIEQSTSQRFRDAPQTEQDPPAATAFPQASTTRTARAERNSAPKAPKTALALQEDLEARLRGPGSSSAGDIDDDEPEPASTKAKAPPARNGGSVESRQRGTVAAGQSDRDKTPAATQPPVGIPVAKPIEQQQQSKVQEAQKCMQLVFSHAEQDRGDLWEQSCRRLNFLCESWPPARDLAYGQSCVTHVIEFMRKHQHIPEIQATGCLLVMGLCRNHGENHQEVDEVNGLEALLGALRDHSVRDTDVAYYSLQCLAVMSVPGRHDAELRKYPELVSLVVDAMRTHLLNEGIQSAGCWALANMCCNSGVEQDEMKSFGVASVLHAINQWSSSSIVLREGCKALANMYHSETNRVTLIRSGALEEVPLTLRRFPNSPDVVTTVLISIATFAATDELRTQICTEELVDDIVARMNGLRQSTDVQEAGCWALANLVTASTGPVLVNRGVVPVVCGVLYRQPFVETLQAMGLMLLFNLACSVKFRIDIVLSGSAELAVNAIRRMAKNEKVVMAAVKLLANLCHESPPREMTQDAQDFDEECQLGRLSVIHSCGIEALIAAMKIYHENLALHNMALLGLQHLSETKSSHALLTEEKIMEIILQSSGIFRLDLSLVDKVLGLLENVLLTPNAVDVFIACGGLHIVVSLMGQHSNTAVLQTRAAVIMARVATADGQGQSYWKQSESQGKVLVTSPLCKTTDSKGLSVAKAGGIWLLKTAMDEWPSVPGVQAAACQALTCMASNETVAELIVKGDCLRSIAAAMLGCLDYEMVQERGASALLALCNADGFTANFYRAHGDTAVKAAHRRYPKCETIVYLAQHVVSS